uniref:C6 domain-containing protein n=1 Tax=Strongyloides venezuelensis TaxID=75913 RepID=A0A0K0FMV8_STRVS
MNYNNFFKFFLFSILYNASEFCMTTSGNTLTTTTTSLPLITTTALTTTVTITQTTTTTALTTTTNAITCGAITVLKNDPANSLDITQTETQQADGTSVLEIECVSPDPLTTVTFFWNNGNNGMTASTTNTITASLICGNNGNWELTQPDPATGNDVTTEITQIECVFI